MYGYAPGAFMTGKEWRLEVYDAGEPRRVHKSVTLSASSKLIQQIRQDSAEVVK